MELTLFEFHLDDASFTANNPLSGRSGGESTTDVDVTEGEEEGKSGPSTVAFLAGLIFLVAIGVALRRLMREDSEPFEEHEAEAVAA